MQHTSKSPAKSPGKQRPLNPRQMALLQLYAASDSMDTFAGDGDRNMEAQLWKRSQDGTCRALWKRDLLLIVEEHPEKDLLRYEVTQAGRELFEKAEAREKERVQMLSDASILATASEAELALRAAEEVALLPDLPLAKLFPLISHWIPIMRRYCPDSIKGLSDTSIALVAFFQVSFPVLMRRIALDSLKGGAPA